MKITAVIAIAFLQVLTIQAELIHIDPVTVPVNNASTGSCPSNEERQNVRHKIYEAVSGIIQSFVPECGEGRWDRVAYLNMSDPSQQCPSAWREYSNNETRACGPPYHPNGPIRASTSYPTNHQYSRVCGTAIGYQLGDPIAFNYGSVWSVDAYYVFVVSITHGAYGAHTHIWTFAAGEHEVRSSYDGRCCPCSNGRDSPSYVSENYYCESGNPSNSTIIVSHLYSNDPLWDGKQCEDTCCSNGKSPPWFTVKLPKPTMDDIEVRIIASYGSSGEHEALVELLEIYVQ